MRNPYYEHIFIQNQFIDMQYVPIAEKMFKVLPKLSERINIL